MRISRFSRAMRFFRLCAPIPMLHWKCLARSPTGCDARTICCAREFRVTRTKKRERALTLADRAADLIAEFGGSWKFIGVSMALIVFWIIFNSFILVRRFRSSALSMLNLALAMIAGMQAPIIMMSQNRQGEKDRLRADLDYQVNLKNELSLTEVLRRLDVLESERLPKLFDDLRTQTK